MKNLFLATSFALTLILLGCYKEELLEPVTEQATDVYYILEQEGDTYYWNTISQITNDRPEMLPAPSADYITTSGAYIQEERTFVDLTWTGVFDETGFYGPAEIEVVSPTFSFHFLMEAIAVVGKGDEAIYEGTIVRIISMSGDVPKFELNWRFCFNVIDTDSMSMTENDKISKAMMFGSPRSALICSLYPPGHYMWSRAGYNKVMPPGYVVVTHMKPEIR